MYEEYSAGEYSVPSASVKRAISTFKLMGDLGKAVIPIVLAPVSFAAFKIFNVSLFDPE
jgi:hypothetical protein